MRTPLLVMALILALPSMGTAQRRLVIAHRGASGYLPEHTLEAKAVAHAQGADFIEQDVVLSRDGIPIILHDIHLDTVTDVATVFPERKREDGRFYAIDFDLAEIKRLRVHERISLTTGRPIYPGRFPSGSARFEVPTLEEEIQLIQGLNHSTGRDVGLYTEIKAPAWHREQGQDITPRVLALLAQYGYSKKSDLLYLQCFDWKETRRIRTELGYQGRLIQLIGENSWGVADTDFEALRTPEGLKEIATVADGIGPSMQHIVAVAGPGEGPRFTSLVKDAHALGLVVHPYTLRADALPPGIQSFDEALGLFFLDAGVDGIFTDFPDRAVAFLRSLDDD